MEIVTTEVDETELKAVGKWVVANVDTGIAWPPRPVKISYDGRIFYLLPQTESYKPAIVLNISPEMSYELGRQIILRFMSIMSWVEGRRLDNWKWSGGSHPYRLGTPKFNIVSPDFDLTYLPVPETNNQRLALALYREGLNLNDTPYAFLSFYKVINLLFPKSKQQIAWINSNIEHIKDKDAKQRVDQIISSGKGVGEYLYGESRSAIAHAGGVPTVDPEDVEHLARIDSDIPLMRALAIHAIEKELSIKQAMTVYREHLYELEGFKRLLGEGGLETIMRGQGSASFRVPLIDIGLRRMPPYSCLIGLETYQVGVDQGAILLLMKNKSDTFRLRVILNFDEERLIFNPFADIQTRDDGSVEAMVTYADISRFRGDYIANGELIFHDSDSKEVLGRCDPCMPVNIDPAGTRELQRQQAERFLEEAAKRGSGRDTRSS